jgi:K+-sensing histidine kinase KdpD
LSTLARALQRDEEELTGEEQSEMLDRIDSYAHHLDAVLREVAEVLTSESLEAEHRLHHADIYLPQLIGEAAGLSGLGPDRVVIRSRPGENVIRSDPDKALRILVKLLEEAGRHAPRETTIEVDIRRCDERLELCVSPGGAGEDESLGLWIAARLAEAMGGGLEADREVLRAWVRTS